MLFIRYPLLFPLSHLLLELPLRYFVYDTSYIQVIIIKRNTLNLIKHHNSVIVNLDQVTHIELDQTSTEFHIVFYHHFSYMQEEYRNVKENFHETTWYFTSSQDRNKVYQDICSKYVSLI